MVITVHLSAALDADLRKMNSASGKFTDTSRAFRQLLATHALKPEPLFASHQQPTHAGIWHVVVPDNDTGTIVKQLLNTPGVEAAYTKPADDLPTLI
jgi:hypothetical protein